MKFRKTPSELIDLPRYIGIHYGYNEWFICSQFDEAVLIIGNQIEAKTYDRDEDGNLLYSVRDILDGKLMLTGDSSRKETQVTQLSRNSHLIRPKPTVNKTL